MPAPNRPSQSVPQAIPSGVLLTVPRPAFVTATGYCVPAFTKVAMTAVAPLSEMRHVGETPRHEPSQPAKTSPEAGAAVSVSVDARANDPPHTVPHWIPTGVLETVPWPVRRRRETSDVPGIDCGTSCVGGYGAGVPVTLTPSASPVAWGGACSGSDACVVPMTRARAVTASIGGAVLGESPVAVSVTGQGTVVSTPAGIQCGTACGGSFARGSPLALTAAPAPGEVFAGWDGSCRGVTPTCRTSLKGPTAVVATFVKTGTQYPVAVTKAGRGTVKSTPAGSPAARTARGGSGPARTPFSPRRLTRAGLSFAGAGRARGRRRPAGST